MAARFRELLIQLSPNPTQEAVVLICLNSRNQEIGNRLISMGTSTQALIGVADTLRSALLLGGTAFAISHNHPSGDPLPSCADMRITRSLKDGALAIGLNFHDHIVIGEASNDPQGVGYYSFKQAGAI